MTSETFDVVVVGGGPCGSTVSTLVAQQGHRVLVLERERFPRYQIGESLLPSTVHGICKLLGVTEELAAAGFPIKHGGTFRWGSNPEPWTFDFSLSQNFAGDSSTGYQVERMKFDKILLDNARAKGVEVREESTVVDVIEEDGRACGVRYTDAAGERHEVRSRYVVDASGNTSRIHGHSGGKRVYSDFFRNLALFGYFEGGKRLDPPYSGNILAVAFEAGWFWYIPLSDTLTSVGAVLLPEELERVQGDKERALLGLIEQCPLIADMLSDATRVTTGVYGDIRVRKDYSYLQERFWKPGLVLAGDAACFIDPVFSQGVHLATYGALLAARSLNTALAEGTDIPEETVFSEFEHRYRAEYSRFHDFLVAFYDMHQDEESYFWKAKKVTAETTPAAESFVNLVGGGASQEGALVDPETYTARAEAAQELSAAIDRRVEGAGNQEILNTSLVRSIVKEGHQIQIQAALGRSDRPTPPVRDGGLVPSADGMHWTLPTPKEA
ncbi:tryptophan 7-halogenase [Dactylosporangium sp. NPDC049742]|uniref:tryptophan 7-halogenase n=1 Tax=Dactylosporangium sp. NPDC049742 TaxID=3154737 RepID=UPI00343323EB